MMPTTATIRRGVGVVALAAGLQALSGGANAFVITTTGFSSGGSPVGQPLYEVSGLVLGDSFDLSWGGVTGLAGFATVSVLALSETEATVHVVLVNNSTPIGGSGDPRFTGFGLNGNFSALDEGSSDAGNDLDGFDTHNFPGFGVMVCATSGNNCAGGGSGGLLAGQSDAFSLVLDGAFGTVPALTLRDFALKVQGGPDGPDGDSYQLAGVPTDDTPPGDIGQIPEPAALAVLGFSLLGLGYIRRRRAA